MGDKAPSTIEIFLRLRPVKSPSDRVSVDQSEAKVEFNLPRDTSQGYINNQRRVLLAPGLCHARVDRISFSILHTQGAL